MATITTAANKLEAAHGETQTARQTAVTKTSIMHEKEAALEALLRQLAGDIESVPTTMSKDSQCWNQRQDNDTRDSDPQNAHCAGATEGDHEREIDLSWDTVKGAESYVIERSPDLPTATSWLA